MEDFDKIDEQMQRALDIVENAADITDEQLAELDADKELLQDCRDLHSVKMMAQKQASAIDVDKEYKAFEQRHQPRRKHKMSIWWGIAAAAAAVFIGFIFLQKEQIIDDEQPLMVYEADAELSPITITSKRTGKEITARANNGVILATGGFAGNVELRQKYCEGEKWPDLSAKVLTTNTSGVRGDGIFMAEAAGAALVNMEQIQLLPYCNPWTGLVNDVVGGGDGSSIFLNKEGKRFVREDGRRDDMSKAIIAQTDGMMYIFGTAKSYGVTDVRDCKTLGGQPVSYLLDTNPNGYIAADTLEEMAEKLGFPYENLKATLDSYNEHVRAGTADEFGRVTFKDVLEEGPFIATARKPAAHHTMGGVRIDEMTHALDSEGNIVPGLYCAGEITGVIHGTNRIGGNAIVDYLTFGREAGRNAAQGK